MKSFNSILLVAVAFTVLPGCSKPADGLAEVEINAGSSSGDSTGGDAKAHVVNTAGPTVSFIGPKVDDFSDPDKNSLGIDRQFIDDTASGGQTRAQHIVEKGVLSAKGEIVPPRGQPGWASIVLLLDPQGLPQDASAYEGIRLRARVNEGNLSISANSSEIKNFDYHAAHVIHQSDGEFHEVEIPFAQMKRAWSAQTPLNTRTITSLSLVAFGVQKGSFDFEIDEVRLY